MEFISMLLFLLQVSSAARRRIQVTGEVGGSITIMCPATETSRRKFWCRELKSGTCVTVVSTSPYTHENYRNRIAVTERPREGVFQITITRLEEEDAGLYTCGTGNQNDRGSGRTLQMELKVSNGNAPPRMGMLSAEPLRRDRPFVVPAESGNKGADTEGVSQPQIPNGAWAKYTSYAVPGIKFPENMIIMPTDVIGSTVTYATTGSIKGIPKDSRTIGNAHPRHKKRLLRSNYGSDVFQILIPVLLIMLLLVASMIIVRKQLRGKKEAASSETYGINLRLSALEHGPGHIPMENIYSVLPHRLEGADRNKEDYFQCSLLENSSPVINNNNKRERTLA